MPRGWAEIDGALEREFRFADFAEAIAFVNQVAVLAEAEDHHPDIAIHWSRVRLRYWTHAARAITSWDYDLARRTNELVRIAEPEEADRPGPGVGTDDGA